MRDKIVQALGRADLTYDESWEILNAWDATVKQAEDAQAARVRAEEALRQTHAALVAARLALSEDEWPNTVALIASALNLSAAAGADTETDG